jgi:acetyl-CoA carboxylase carboxyltransferase component
MTSDAFAYVTGPEVVTAFTGVAIDSDRLGGASVHERESGVATFVVADEDDAELALAALLSYLPANHLADPPYEATDDPVDRSCTRAASAVPARATASYDVRTVLDDVLDEHSFLELRPAYAPNMVTGLGRLGGRPVGIVANQPMFRAGTLDIEASRKAARFVQWCDAFNFPILTFVDTPGFEPGRDLEWRGMIRHGAELVHAYAEATVPRLCLLMRKAYGGAYIVMDSKHLGNDWCVADRRGRGDGCARSGADPLPTPAGGDRGPGRTGHRAARARSRVRGPVRQPVRRRGARLRRRRDRRDRHPAGARRRAAAPLHQARAAARATPLQLSALMVDAAPSAARPGTIPLRLL